MCSCYEHSFERGFGGVESHQDHLTTPSGMVEIGRYVKRKEYPREKGQAVQEFDRETAHQTRGENLTERQFRERAGYIAELRHAIDAWKLQHVPEGVHFDQRLLKGLVDYLSEQHGETIKQITKDFLDRDMYPTRPVVKLRLQEHGEMPDVLLFGWRASDQETQIHDHSDSTLAVRVHEGAIEEKVYPIRRDEWLQRKPGFSMKYSGYKQKRYESGLSKTAKSPYIHQIGGTADHDLSVTIHAYWRASSQPAYDFKVEGDRFIEIGVS